MDLRKILTVAAFLAGAWLGVKYLLPVALPFLLGGALALAAEPLVRPLSAKIPRGAAAGVGVTAALVGLLGVVSLAGAVAVKELSRLSGVMPQLADSAQQGLVVLQDWMVGLSESAPERVRPMLQRSVLEVFDDGSMVLEQLSRHLPGMVTGTLSKVGNGVLGVGTGLIAAFLISARLPKLKAFVHARLPETVRSRWLPGLRRVQKALTGWLKAQLKLAAVTWGIVTVGFFLLGIPYAPAWAALVALVDAIPILGTGTVLVPWAVVCLLQKNGLRAMGLLCTYAAAAITRTVLEPRLMGRQLGLDPLTTLVALYAGYRFWGIGGLLLTPILASAAKSLATAEK